MTNEEAKKIIFNQWQAFLDNYIDYGQTSEAYKLAIKALEQEPCEDTISRQAAIAVTDYADYAGLAIEDVKKVTDEIVKGLKQLPPVTPAPRIGRWIDQGIIERNNRFCVCSECGKGDTQAKGQIVPYCWWCGAKMEVEG